MMMTTLSLVLAIQLLLSFVHLRYWHIGLKQDFRLKIVLMRRSMDRKISPRLLLMIMYRIWTYAKLLLGRFARNNNSSETDQPQSIDLSKSLLYFSLQQRSMRCGLWACRAKRRDGGNVKHLMGYTGCNGLEMYCCRAHQTGHWPLHKKFCKAISQHWRIPLQ